LTRSGPTFSRANCNDSPPTRSPISSSPSACRGSRHADGDDEIGDRVGGESLQFALEKVGPERVKDGFGHAGRSWRVELGRVRPPRRVPRRIVASPGQFPDFKLATALAASRCNLPSKKSDQSASKTGFGARRRSIPEGGRTGSCAGWSRRSKLASRARSGPTSAKSTSPVPPLRASPRAGPLPPLRRLRSAPRSP
jgi:hypothetical protein